MFHARQENIVPKKATHEKTNEKLKDCVHNFLHPIAMELQTKIQKALRTGKLDVSDMNLTSLPKLPLFLTHLNCHNNKLTCLPPLPTTLVELGCAYNSLEELPPLPEGLDILFCSENKLRSLPKLPKSLTQLYCSYNCLKNLPELPNLTQLYCSDNALTQLPKLEEDLTYLAIENNALQTLPPLPKSLKYMYSNNNPWNMTFQSLVQHKDSVQRVNTMYTEKRIMHQVLLSLQKWSMVIEKKCAEDVCEDVIRLIGSYLSGKNEEIEEQIQCLKSQIWEGIKE